MNSNYVSEQIDKILSEVSSRTEKYGTTEREGQTLMNALHSVRPDFYSRLMDENGPDPFYNDDLIHECWDRIVTELTIEMERGFE